MISPTLLSRPRAQARLDEAIPAVLRPVVRAYVLGYASAIAPRLLTLALQHGTRWRKGRGLANETQPHDSFVESLRHILCGGLDPQRFPTFCAALVGGATIFDVRLSL
jgi:hypothetical protein